MKTLVLDLPAMYGDHHVIEVKRLLLELPGVGGVYASSCFQSVEIQFDEAKLGPDEIKTALEKAGYLGELPVPVEKGALAEKKNGDRPFFRQSTAYANTARTVSFAQQVPYAGRPLWPCPGIGVIHRNEEVENG